MKMNQDDKEKLAFRAAMKMSGIKQIDLAIVMECKKQQIHQIINPNDNAYCWKNWKPRLMIAYKRILEERNPVAPENIFGVK